MHYGDRQSLPFKPSNIRSKKDSMSQRPRGSNLRGSVLYSKVGGSVSQSTRRTLDNEYEVSSYFNIYSTENILKQQQERMKERLNIIIS
jgi:hypothetical protein